MDLFLGLDDGVVGVFSQNIFLARTFTVGGISLATFLAGQIANGSLASRGARAVESPSVPAQVFAQTSELGAHLRGGEQPSALSLQLLNGLKMRCPDRSLSERCRVARLELPVECGDACLSAIDRSGTAILQGQFVTRFRGVGTPSESVFQVRALYLSNVPVVAANAVYRLSELVPHCGDEPCGAVRSILRVNRHVAFVVRGIDFAASAKRKSDGTTETQQPSLRGSEGMLAAGKVENGVFVAASLWQPFGKSVSIPR